MNIVKFSEKLNKIPGNVYTVEELVNTVDGVYEADLAHDNIDPNTINIYTGSKLTGDKINTYTISTPSLTPWRTHIKIYSNEVTLYISYETIGDTVEADDINAVQDAIIGINNTIDNERKRAENAENTLQNNIDNEVTRATNSESTLQNNIDAEKQRAETKENTLDTNLNNEITRATNVENTLTTDLNDEVTRAKKEESDINTLINTNKPVWDDKYTKAEVDNKISSIITNMSWKQSVDTYDDLATTYPTPQNGWTVTVNDTDITYTYNGTEWIAISANTIPLATSSVDGKMSKEDKSFLDTVKSTWTNITNHIKDTVIHITSAERTLWNTVSNKFDKTGGTITIEDYRGVEIKRNAEWGASILYSNNNESLGDIGFSSDGNLIVSKGSSSAGTGDILATDKTNNNIYAFGKKIITEGDSVATQTHTHSNKDILDKITNEDLTRVITTIGTGADKTNMWYKLATITITKRYDDCNAFFYVQDYGHGSGFNSNGFIRIRVKQQEDMGQTPNGSLILQNIYGLNINNFKLIVTENTTEKTIVSLYYYNPDRYSTLRLKLIDVFNLSALTLYSGVDPISTLPSGTVINTKDVQSDYIKKGMTWDELEGI